MTAIKIPVRCRGRMSADAQANYDTDVQAFCDALMEIASTLDFKMSGRGWCYYLESYGLTKGDFDKAQDLINDCRKSGYPAMPTGRCWYASSGAFIRDR